MGERETFYKRPREEAEGEATAEAKRHHYQQSQQQRPSYHHLLSSLLEEEGAGSGEDEGEISSLMTALQQELSSSSSSDGLSPPPATLHSGEPLEAGLRLAEEQGCDAEGVMRRLLEASDDDLGIPPSGDADGEGPAAPPEEAAVYSVWEEEKVGTAAGGGGGGGGGFWVENLDMDAMAASYCSYDFYALLPPEVFL